MVDVGKLMYDRWDVLCCGGRPIAQGWQVWIRRSGFPKASQKWIQALRHGSLQYICVKALVEK